ncbi:MAG: carboxypeptidase regulatory-like domain-containing protein [Pyrinomonadaceae bacterium]
MCFLLLFFSCLNTFAQYRSTVSGYVFGPGRSPVGQVAVELRNDVNSVIGRTRSDGSGRFIFGGVPSGRLSITVLPLGTNLEGQTKDFEIAGVGARGQLIPENVQIDFYLKGKKGTELAGGSAVVFAQEVPEEAVRIYKAAISDLDSQRPQLGIAGLKHAIEIFPTYFFALERLGAEELKQERYDGAAKSFSASVSVNQRSFVSWYGLSYANFALKKWQAVVESAEKALELEKNSVNTLILLGISQRSLQKFEEAEKSLVHAKKIDEGKTPDLYWNLALLYAYNLKKYQDAADALELYLKANPAVPDEANVRKLIKKFRENRPPLK